jgi:hypothetical protein
MTKPVVPDLSAIVTQADVERLQRELAQLPQYEPLTKHYFHGEMYCREVWRASGVLVVGAVHRKEHFYVIVSGIALITDGNKPAKRVIGPAVMLSMPGIKRAVYAETDVLCMTFHRTDATTVEAAESELVEDDPGSQYGPGNRLLQLEEVTP